jgi:adenosine deaminase
LCPAVSSLAGEGLQCADERFDIDELVDLAKCMFSDVGSIDTLERLATGNGTTALPLAYSRQQVVTEWGKSQATGRMHQMRRLRPGATDEAVEHRIARVLRRNSEEEVRVRASRGGLPAGTRPLEAMSGIDTMLPALLERLADTFLCEGRDGSIRVRSRYLATWQRLVLAVPPLLVCAAFVAARISHEQLFTSNYTEQCRLAERLNQWLCDSTLPVDDNPFLDHLRDTEGFDEVHLHLNGTTEAEKIWMDALERPQQVVGHLTGRSALSGDNGLVILIGNGVRRLLRQEDESLTPEKLLQRTLDAVELKTVLLEELRVGDAQGTLSPRQRACDTGVVTAYRHERNNLLPHVVADRLSRVAQEAWQLAAIFHGLRRPHTPIGLHVVMWHYGLLRAQFCRLLVQQSSQKGFDQFQYITLNELREESEKTFAERFRQIERGHQRDVSYLEGRFAPKASPDATAKLIGQVVRGYLEFLSEDAQGRRAESREVGSYESLPDLLRLVVRREGRSRYIAEGKTTSVHNVDSSWASDRRLRLGLVAHFIKQSSAKDREAFFGAAGVRPKCRDFRLRTETDQRARALVALLDRTPGLDALLRGIDAASNERHAGPEVFAPTYRRMRGAGLSRFTYHAGEDFAHLASGLRAITEAVTFLELGAGCRIGHGTAAGLSPKKWWKSVGGVVVMPIEERLDDLVLARELFLRDRVASDRLPLIEAEILRLAMRIWNDPHITPQILIEAWRLRTLDPLVRETQTSDVDCQKRSEALRHRAAKDLEPLIYKHFLRRHGVKADVSELQRAREDVVVSSASDVLRPSDLRVLQQSVLRLVHDRRVAIETLPSSNVRISIHESYEDHHAGFWLGVGKKRASVLVDVVVGSDDPGIFATGLRNEYSHLLSMLESRRLDGDPIAEDVLRRVCTAAKQYRF